MVGTDEDMLVEGSKVGIETGLSYSVDLLFKAMLLDSGNDARRRWPGSPAASSTRSHR